MEHMRVTSWEFNQPNKFFFMNEKSIISGFISLLIGMSFSDSISNFFFNDNTIRVITPFIFGFVGYKMVEYLMNGKYPSQRIESIKGTIIRYKGIKKIWLNDEKLANYKFSGDINSFFDIEGNEIFGFEITLSHDNSLKTFQNIVETILKDLKPLDQIQFIRVSKDLNKESLFEKNPILKEKKVKQQNFYIFFSISDTTLKLKESISNKVILGRRLTRSEISNLAEYIFAPRRKPSGKDLPFYLMSMFFNDKYLETSSDNFVTASSSLAALPKHYVTEQFKNFLDPIKQLDSIISVKFTKNMNVMQSLKDTLNIFKFENLDFRKKSNQKKLEAYEQQKIDASEGKQTKLFMHFSIVVTGNNNDVENGLLELENNADESEVNFRPVFARETHFLKEVLLSILPGSRKNNRFKELKVNSTEEAFLYIPSPTVANDLTDDRAFPMRTIDNALWLFPYYKPKTTLICGLPGFGKSLLASLFFYANIKSYQKGYPAAGFVLDLGDSFLFLEDQLADFILQLNYDNSVGKYKPLEIHPLELFKPFGDRIKYAQRFLCNIMGFDPSDKTQSFATDGEVVSKSLEEFYQNNLSNLTDFKNILIGKLELFFEKSVQKQIKMSNWEEFIARLNVFCKGGLNGEVFEPEHPKYNADDIKNVRFFYASKNTQTKDDVSLISAFASLVISFADLMEEKFKSGGENDASNFFYCVDEMQWWSEYMPHTWFRERANQNRKFGASLWLITQNLENLIVPRAELEKKTISSPYALLEAVQRFFFYTLPQNNEVVKILAKESLNEKGIALKGGRVEKMHQIANRISEIKNIISIKRDSPIKLDRIVGYCDEELNLMPICVDIDKEQLWAFTTHDGARSIRKKALKYCRLSYTETCKLLAKWPGQIPENQVSKQYENDILKTAFDLKEISLQ